MNANRPEVHPIERWINWAKIAAGGAFVALLLRMVEILRRPEREQTLELSLTIGLVLITTVCLLVLLLRRRRIRAGIDAAQSRRD